MAYASSIVPVDIINVSLGSRAKTFLKKTRSPLGRYSSRSLIVRAVKETEGPRRLVDIIRIIPDISRNYFRSRSRRALFGGISLLGGFYVAQTISLSFGALGVNDVIAAVVCVLLTEYVTRFYYSRPKEHGLGSDVSLKNLDRSVSSFAMQLRYPFLGSELASGGLKETEEGYQNGVQTRIAHLLQGVHDNEFKLLGDSLKELGHFMMEMGLRLAQICDQATGGRELQQSLMDSGSAKARLIHYHSSLDNLVLKGINCRPKGSIQKARSAAPFLSNFHGCATSGSKAVPSSGRGNSDEQEIVEHLNKLNLTELLSKNCFSKLWQQWHYDYGIFTVLTAPFFMSSSGKEKYSSVEGIQEYPSPDEHTYLQLFDTNKNKIFLVKTSPGSFIVQVGEAADILSRGKLRSTLHSVGRPTELHTLSRQTFVVFLQPAWDKILCYPDHLLDAKTVSPKKLESNNGTSHFYSKSDVVSSSMEDSKSYQLIQEILRNIPPLSSRLRDGMTFAEFSRETTKQYYGGNGMQSNIY